MYHIHVTSIEIQYKEITRFGLPILIQGDRIWYMITLASLTTIEQAYSEDIIGSTTISVLKQSSCIL
jgi:hypothetical protein